MTADEVAASAFAAGSLAAALCNADEVRRPIDEDARTRKVLQRHAGKRASAAIEEPGSGPDARGDPGAKSNGTGPRTAIAPSRRLALVSSSHPPPVAGVLPKGRNFH